MEKLERNNNGKAYDLPKKGLSYRLIWRPSKQIQAENPLEPNSPRRCRFQKHSPTK